MSGRIEYKNSTTRALEEAEGSDGRLNVSARADARSYYNSRDERQTYSVVFDHQTAAVGEVSAYWQNTSATGKTLVISSIDLNAIQIARIKLWKVTGTAAGGSVLTPTNLNIPASEEATANARQGDVGDAITGLVLDEIVAFSLVPANGFQEMKLSDRVRLGQNDAIALEYDEGTSGDFFGTIFGFYE